MLTVSTNGRTVTLQRVNARTRPPPLRWPIGRRSNITDVGDILLPGWFTDLTARSSTTSTATAFDDAATSRGDPRPSAPSGQIASDPGQLGSHPTSRERMATAGSGPDHGSDERQGRVRPEPGLPARSVPHPRGVQPSLQEHRATPTRPTTTYGAAHGPVGPGRHRLQPGHRSVRQRSTGVSRPTAPAPTTGRDRARPTRHRRTRTAASSARSPTT